MKARKVFAVIGIVMIFVIVSVPLVSALDFTVSLRIGDSEFVDSVSTLRGDAVSQYHTGDSIVYEDLVSFQIKASLNDTGKLNGFNGFFVTLTDPRIAYGANVIKDYVVAGSLQEVHLSNGTTQYFIYDDLYFTWALSTPYQMILTFTPVYFNQVDSMTGGYEVGYDSGYKDAQTQYMMEIERLKNENQALTESLSDAMNFDLEQYGKEKVAEGMAAAPATVTFVQDVVETGVDGFGDIISQFFSLKVLGIPVYSILLVATILPLAFAVFKLVMHRG